MLLYSHGSVYRYQKHQTNIQYLKKADTDTDVGICNTKKYRIPTIRY